MATDQQHRKKWPTFGKRTRVGVEERTPEYALKTPHYAITDITREHDTSLVTQFWVGEEPC
jgi:hypothetical protein